MPTWLQRATGSITPTGSPPATPSQQGKVLSPDSGSYNRPTFNSKQMPAAAGGQLHPQAEQYINSVHQTLVQTYQQRKCFDINYRITQLKNLKRMITENEKMIWDALKYDLGKGEQESWLTETSFVTHEIDIMLKHIKSWTKPKSVSTNMLNFPSSSKIYRDPLGVVLIISPWNYPINLLLAPFIGAIAGGNCVVLKPSELAAATASVIAQLVPKYMDRSAYAVVTGGIPETTKLLDLEWQTIFYTGSGNVGRKVMTAAAKYLTPVILELGGKSPTYVSKHANIKLAALRVMWGKFTNAGQTCVAPDYCMVHRDVMKQFLDECAKVLKKFYASDNNRINTTPDYGRIISDNHFWRLSKLLSDQRHVELGIAPPQVFIGGEMDPKTRFIAPTILTHVQPQHAIMEDEIFGPILPIMTVDSAEQAVAYINSRDKPLAMYIFSGNSSEIDMMLKNTSAGGVVVNDTLLHLTNAQLPFGGVGASGMGSYHGLKSLDVFTHQKSVLRRPNLGINYLDDVPVCTPPDSVQSVECIANVYAGCLCSSVIHRIIRARRRW